MLLYACTWAMHHGHAVRQLMLICSLTVVSNAATCILFGDGTGAVVMTAQQGQCSLLGMDSHSDGAGQRHLNVSLFTRSLPH